MRRFFRIVFIVAALLALVLGGIYLYYIRLGGLERMLTAELNNALAGSNISIQVASVRGGFISGVRVSNIDVFYEANGLKVRLAHAAKIDAQYSFRNLWNKKYILSGVQIDSLALVIHQNDSGQFLLPNLSPKEGPPGEPPLISIEALSMTSTAVTIVRPTDTLLFTDGTLIGSFDSEDNTYSAIIRTLGFNAQPERFSLSSASGKVTYAGGNLVFQDWQLSRRLTRLKASGSLAMETRSGAIEFSGDNIDLQEIGQLFGPKLKGEVDLNGRLTYEDGVIHGQVGIGGRLLFASLENLFVKFTYADKLLGLDTLYGTVLGSCSIDGFGEMDFGATPKAYRLSADLRGFDLKQIVTNSFSSDLGGHVEFKGQSFHHEDLLLKVDVDLRESSFHEYPLHTARGAIAITTDSLWFPDSIKVSYFENEFRVIGRIDYRNEIDLAITADLKNLDRYRGKLFIDQPGGRGYAEATLTGRTADPDLQGFFASDSLWLYGLFADRCHSMFDIDRFLHGRQGWVEVAMDSGQAWSLPYGHAYAMITLDSTMATIDTLSVFDDYATVHSHGVLDYGTMPNHLVLDTFALEILNKSFFNLGQLRVEVDSIGFDFDHVQIGLQSAKIALDGRINYDESMACKLDATDVLISPWLHLAYPDMSLDGYLSCQADFGGSFLSPTITLRGSVDSLVYRDLILGDLTTSAHYEDHLMSIDSLVILSDPGEYRASGHFYADLVFARDAIDRLPDRPFDLKFSATDSRFDLVSLFLPSVEDLQGDFFTDFALTGTPTDPHLEGEAFLRNGRLKYFDLVDTLRADSAVATMTNNRIVLDNLEAYVWDRKKNRKRYAEIDGELMVKSLDTLHYDLDITLEKEFPFRYELDDIEGIVEGELQVFGDTPPAVSGDLTLLSCRYRAEFVSDDEIGSPLMLALSGENTWDLNINIEIPSNYWIKNQDIDAELAGFMNLIRESGKYRFIGELEILKGKGFLFDKTFRIESDSRVTFEDVEYPNPRLDVRATARIPLSKTDEDTDLSEIELTIQVGGTLENPEFDIVDQGSTGGASLTREDILPLILANSYGAQSGNPGQFDARVSQLISSQVSQIGTRRLGVETFEIDPTYQGDLDLRSTRVTLGMYTSSNLYVYGRSAVSFDRGQEVGFQYRFNKAFQMEGKRDELELYHLNLKLHWEF